MVGVAAIVLPTAGAAPRPDGAASGTARTTGTSTTTTMPPGASTPAASRASAKASAQASAASLRRDRSAVRAEVAALQQQRDDQFNRWALTQMALEHARNEAIGAVMRAEKARRDALSAKDQLTEYATEAFMSPPATESLAVLSIGDATDASRAHELLTIVADEQRAVVGDFLDAHTSELRRSEEAEKEAAQHAAAEEASAVELRRLDELLARQEALDAEIDSRLDAALAEVAALEAIDRKAARDLEAQERELAAQSKAAVAASPASRAVTARSSPAPAGSAAAPSGGGSSGGATGSTPAAPPPTTTTTTPPKSPGPPPAPPSGLATWQDVTKVGGIWVHRSIAARVQALLDAAAASGIRLGGGGFRDPSEQIRLRQAHCGPTEYDIYVKPASQCTPPTAQPGKSMHERGLAIDFTVGGRVISSRSDPAFQWLAANAASYGLYNLPSEPWHWSTNGS